MRWKALVSLGAVAVGMMAGGWRAWAADAVLLRHHFAGLTELVARPDLEAVKAILGLPESKRLRGEVDRKLARHLPVWFGGVVGDSTNHLAGALPWVRMALDRETYVEVLGSEKAVGSWAVAVRMDGDTASAVGRSLRGALEPFLGASEGQGAGESWELPGKEVVRRPAARYGRVGEWALLGSGKGAFDGLRDRIEREGSPTAPAPNLVSRLEADLTPLAALLGWRAAPVAPVAQWPAVRWAVEPRNGKLRTTGDLRFREPLGLELAPWTLPNKMLHDPLVGFTAVQGADRWLGGLSMFQPYGVTEWPRQLFLWSVAGDPWNQYLAGPMASPTNLMAKVSLPLPMRMVTNMSWRGQVFGLRVTNQAMRVEFRGLPYLLPFLESIQDSGATMLYGGLFPQPSKGEPAPAGLLQQVSGRTNLVLYDWETTGRSVLWTNPPGTAGPRVTTNSIGRLAQFKQLSQYWRLMMNTNTMRIPLTPGGEIWVPGWDWINAAQGRLGDSITEVTRTGDSQLSAVRNSQLGFNALEVMYLLRWIENPAFPGWSGDAYVPPGAKTVPVPQSPGGVVKP